MSLISPGYQYLTETRFDQIEPVLETIRREVVALGLPLRSVEIELGPSQCEFTFQPQIGLAPADTMMLFRSAVKQICRRHGLSRELHVPAEGGERDVERLASASVAARQAHGANAFVSNDEEAALPHGPALSRRAARACARGGDVHDADRSTATSATAAIRWRPTGRSGRATIAA